MGMHIMFEKVGERVCGNAMAVPLIGSVLAMEMLCLMSHGSPEKRAHLCKMPTMLTIPDTIHPPVQQRTQEANARPARGHAGTGHYSLSRDNSQYPFDSDRAVDIRARLPAATKEWGGRSISNHRASGGCGRA